MNKVVTLVVIAAMLVSLDMLWFTWSVKALYRPAALAIQGSSLRLRLVGGVVAWLLLAWGIQYFVLGRQDAWVHGAVLGLVVYGVYNGTTYAMFGKYPLHVAVMDTLWGTFAMGTASWVASNYLQ